MLEGVYNLNFIYFIDTLLVLSVRVLLTEA